VKNVCYCNIIFLLGLRQW